VIEMQQKTAYTFTSTVGGTTYSFQVFAESAEAARKQLADALGIIRDELHAVKSGGKSN
jgi:hypothetical protein